MYRKLKERVYEANMELFHRKLIVYTWGNVSEVDREKGVMAIKPSGVPYEELKPEMMVIQSLETGEVLSEGYRPSTDAPTHLAIYRAFEEVGGMVHTHSTCATAWAQAGLAIPCMGTTHRRLLPRRSSRHPLSDPRGDRGGLRGQHRQGHHRGLQGQEPHAHPRRAGQRPRPPSPGARTARTPSTTPWCWRSCPKWR